MKHLFTWLKWPVLCLNFSKFVGLLVSYVEYLCDEISMMKEYTFGFLRNLQSIST